MDLIKPCKNVEFQIVPGIKGDQISSLKRTLLIMKVLHLHIFHLFESDLVEFVVKVFYFDGFLS